MRVFIKELDILKINLNRLEKLQEYLVKSTHESYMYSDENIYQINSRQINKLMQYDEIVVHEYFPNLILEPQNINLLYVQKIPFSVELYNNCTSLLINHTYIYLIYLKYK